MRARRIVVWSALGFAAALVGIAIALAVTAWWSVRSERGSAWLLSLLPGVQVEAPRGRLLGDFDAQKIVVQLPGGHDTITLTGLAWRGLAIERIPGPQWFGLRFDTLAIARVDLALAASDEPMKAPADLRLPIELELRALQIGELYASGLGTQPLRALEGALHLGANRGTEHRIGKLSLAWDRLTARGEARIASTAPMTLAASIQFAQQAAATLPAWNASATLAGPLATPTLHATLRAAPSTTHAEQSLDAQAVLHPFARWPLGELNVSTTALDLAALADAAPTTALTGQAIATTTAANAPATLAIELSNALAGRWNEAKLPLRNISALLVARPDQTDALTLQRISAELGTPQGDAGRITGNGQWSPGQSSISATLTEVRPAQLDARAPAMRLSGPLTATLISSAIDGSELHLKTELDGRLDAARDARSIKLALATTLAPRRIELQQLDARAGDAHAQAEGTISRASDIAPWAVKAKATLVDFDPGLWWPGRDDSPWRRADNRVNANADIDLSVPSDARAKPLPAALAAVQGQAALTLQASRLAGVPLSGNASLRSGAPALAAIELLADGNRLRATSRVASGGDGASDAWDVSIDAPTLARLAPLYRLVQPTAGANGLAGALNANAKLGGRWPTLTSQGSLSASALRIGPIAIATAQGTWTLGTSANAAVDVQLTLGGVGTENGARGPSIGTAQLQLKGTARAHTLELRAESSARPPAWVDTLQATATPPSPSATTLLVQAQGGFFDQADAALAGWRGTLAQLELRGAAPLLQTRDVELEASWAGGPLRASLQPGRADVLGGALRWSRIAWQAASTPGGFAQIDAEAEVEPLRIAPLLARAQPDFGWGGDLSVSARAKLHSAPSLNADIVIERASGDLTVTDEVSTRALGLTDLRLGLAADNGVWNFTQGMAGTTLGVAAGAVVVRTDPRVSWPPADAPIQGVLELQVADLGTWGSWVPPGWRIGGALRASAGINGHFGAPEYTGEVQGSRIAVRNFLQGVNVSDGNVAIRLQGTRAQIERFTAKAGDGSVTLVGGASLGEAPRAELQLTADKFQMLGRVDRRIVASGQGRLQLDAKTLALDGRFNVDEGLIDFTRSDAPALAGDVEVVRAKPVGSASAAAAPDPAASAVSVPPNPQRAVALDLNVGLGDKLRVRGRGIDSGLSGDLHITSPGGRIAVNGTVRAVDGTYAAYGQKLSIDKGLIAFNGPIENPRLDIEATRPNIDARVGVAVSGNAASPRIRLFSEPEMSDIDKLSWLVMGRASDGLGRTDTALLQRAALALLAGEGGGITDQLTKAIGLDDIGLRQTDGEVRETVVSLGKQLSRRWYVGYERGLNATTGNFQLIYRIAQRFTLRAQSGEDNSLDLIWTWRWK